MRRRSIASTISIAEVPKPVSIETLAIEAIEARPKLRAAIDDQKSRFEETGIQAARTFASQTQTGRHVDVEKALQSSKVSKESEEQIQQRTEALEYLQERLNKHIDQLKVNHPDAVGAAIDLRLAALEAMRLEKETEEKSIAEEIKSLKTERGQLQKATKKATN